MTVNELIDELIVLREHHRCGDMDVVGVRRTWDACECFHPKDHAKDGNYEVDAVPFVRPRLMRLDGSGTRVVELAPEPVNG